MRIPFGRLFQVAGKRDTRSNQTVPVCVAASTKRLVVDASGRGTLLGSQLPRGSAVQAVLSRGVTLVAVPRLAGLPGDDVDRMTAPLHDQPGGLDAQVLDRLGRRLAGLGAECTAKLARA